MSLYPEWKKRSFLPDAAVSGKYLLGKAGSDKDHVAVIAAAGDEPLCLICDSTLRNGATILDVPLNCEPLTGNDKLLWAQAATAIANGDDIVSYGDGRIASLAQVGNGTYWKVGRCFGDTAAGGAIESADGVHFMPCLPVQVTKS